MWSLILFCVAAGAVGGALGVFVFFFLIRPCLLAISEAIRDAEDSASR